MNKSDRKRLVFYIFIIFIFLYIFFVDSSNFIRKIKIKNKLKKLQADIEFLECENERIKKENENLENNPKTWESKARELGMQKEGEKIFIFKNQEDDQSQ